MIVLVGQLVKRTLPLQQLMMILALRLPSKEVRFHLKCQRLPFRPTSKILVLSNLHGSISDLCNQFMRLGISIRMILPSFGHLVMP